ncbi:Uncharacterised protein [Trueperella bialowiezensis]|uniref:Uncharacterized protein n=1 Tax=Trueperella bialowiezensis TaxID=312285 RepID=A0A448PG18_9ACTO|nr:Uncharacterised protein [Trueperella bialowiezensis]
MARLAQCSQVRLIMGAAMLERHNVMDFLSGRGVATLEAAFAQWVCCDVSVADLSPPVVVAFVDCGVTLILAVAGVFCFRVGWAEPIVSEFWTAGVGTWPLWFPWHPAHPLSTKSSDPQTGYREFVWGSLFLLFNHLLG